MPEPLTPPQQRRLERAEQEKERTRELAVMQANHERLDDALKRWAKPLDKDKNVK
jgi:hypothetical protein